MRRDPLVGLRVSDDVLRRIKALAWKKHRSFQELLAEFIVERLYEEEKREGLVGRGSRR